MVDFNPNAGAANQTQDVQNRTNGFDDLGITSIELMFAKLQNDLAVDNREAAKSRIDNIKNNQKLQKTLSDFIVQLRNTTSGKKDDDKVTVDGTLQNNINKFLKDNGLTEVKFGEKAVDINTAIQSLQNQQESIGSDTQQEMLLIQDLMSKVSSYSQGAIGAINKAGDTLTAIVR